MGNIEIEKIRKEFKERRGQSRNGSDAQRGDSILVLDDIDLTFKDGELVCILGPSGCGKSTLLRIMAGFEKPTSGRVLIDGQPVTGPSSDHIFVFQHNALLPWMTVWENVELGVRNMTDTDAMKEAIQEHIEMVELEGFEDRYPRQLSGGMLRRAELARALVVNPDTLFMDEPFSGLDFLTHMKMREEVVNMHQFIGKTIILVTHDIDDALIMGDRVVVLNSRPSTVKFTRSMDFERPRDYEKMPELSELRSEMYMMLGVHYAV